MIEFAQPLALWTGLAVGLPILAHLAYRRIIKKIPFSSLRFVRSSTIPRSGRRKPSDWLLLILRILFFCMITLLLADPYWKDPDSILPETSSNPKCLFLLDSTSSMAGWGAWEEAKSSIRTRIENSPDTDFGLLVAQGDTVQKWPLGTPSNELIANLDSLSVQQSGGGIQAILDQAVDYFSTSLSSTRIIIVSDFQKSSWQEMESSFNDLKVELELVPVGHGTNLWKERSGNRAVVDTRVAPGGDGKVRVWAALKNWDTIRSDLNVSIHAGGRLRQTVEASLPPQGTQQVQFILPAEDFAQAEVSIEQVDAYPEDNNHSLWILPPLPRTFGFWSNPNVSPSGLLEQQFLGAAMESAGDGNWIRWREDEQRADEMRLSVVDSSLDLLMVLGVSGWFADEGLVEPVLRSLQDGKVVLMTPPLDSHVKMNQALRDQNLLPFTFGGLNRTAFRMEPYRVEVLPEKSQLLGVFSGDSVRDLYLTKIRQFISVKEGEGLSVPLRDRSGKPLVLVRTFPSGGRLVFFTFRIIPEWTDLPMRNAFLPLLVELCSLATRAQLDGQVSRIEAGTLWTGEDQLIDTGTTGLFQQGDQRYEVVHPLSESMPEVMSQNELLEALSGTRRNRTEVTSVDPAEHESSNYSLWPWIALVGTIVLVIEMILSAPSIPTLNREEVQSG